MAAVVEYVLSGHRFKLFIPKETCSIAFSFSGVRCPGRDEPYSEEAIALMRRKIMQRDVEVNCIRFHFCSYHFAAWLYIIKCLSIAAIHRLK